MEKAVAEVIASLRALGCTVEPCGSRVTCNPAPVGTDADYLVEVPALDTRKVSMVDTELLTAGFRWEGGEHYQFAVADGFASYRRGEANMIVTANARFASKHRIATSLCTRLNIMDKVDRIAVFQAVLYGRGRVE